MPETAFCASVADRLFSAVICAGNVVPVSNNIALIVVCISSLLAINTFSRQTKSIAPPPVVGSLTGYALSARYILALSF